jgi:hypothetical protein
LLPACKSLHYNCTPVRLECLSLMSIGHAVQLVRYNVVHNSYYFVNSYCNITSVNIIYQREKSHRTGLRNLNPKDDVELV